VGDPVIRGDCVTVRFLEFASKRIGDRQSRVPCPGPRSSRLEKAASCINVFGSDNEVRVIQYIGSTSLIDCGNRRQF
jgi:hypothetical protein